MLREGWEGWGRAERWNNEETAIVCLFGEDKRNLSVSCFFFFFFICACICKRNCMRVLTAKICQSESEGCLLSVAEVSGSDSRVKGE